MSSQSSMKFKVYTNTNFKLSNYYLLLPDKEKKTFDILSSVFHFKVNSYVLEKLIDWNNIPADPIYKLVFPRREMLNSLDFEHLSLLYEAGLPKDTFLPFVNGIRNKMMPKMKSADSSHPDFFDKRLRGVTRNFKTIVSLYPAPMMKTCHSYCSYCFRWIMFNNPEIQDHSSYANPEHPVSYIRSLPEVTDVLFTGADPLVLQSSVLKSYIDPILDIDTVKVIRIGTKSLAWWPYRFTQDRDAAALLDLFRYIKSRGKHLNICAHFTHANELATDEVKEAIERIRETGAVIRCQGPLVKDINDSVNALSTLWSEQVKLGLVPYYLFVEANHNVENCFRIPLAQSLKLFQEAQSITTGLARTIRGPVFMNDHFRILIDGTMEIDHKKYFVLKNLQSPPHEASENVIKLLPYDSNTRDLGDLIKLFSTKSYPVPAE